MLEIEKVSKAFDHHPVIRDLSLSLKEGSVFGLVGVNGAGKSTLLRMIAGVMKPDQGRIRLDGSDTFADAEIRRFISFAADEAYVPPGVTIEGRKQLYEAMYEFDSVLFSDYCRTFELNPNAALASLSKGQKRRASLLYALCTHPRLLLLDEAYDGLEPLARLELKRIIAERMEEEQITVIIAGHSLRELEDICDTFGLLDHGSILDSGDLVEKKETLKKYQVAFTEEKTMDAFNELDVLHFQSEGRVVRMVVRGEEGQVRTVLNRQSPVLIDVLPVSFEELFLYEVERRRKTR